MEHAQGPPLVVHDHQDGDRTGVPLLHPSQGGHGQLLRRDGLGIAGHDLVHAAVEGLVVGHEDALHVAVDADARQAAVSIDDVLDPLLPDDWRSVETEGPEVPAVPTTTAAIPTRRR